MKRSVEETADRFDEICSSYDDIRSTTHVYTALRTLEIALNGVDGDEEVLDIGTGTGTLALYIAPHVESVTAIDISKRMLERAREKSTRLGLENIRFGEGRFRSLEQEFIIEGIDLIISNFAMHHLNDEEKRNAIGEMKSVLSSNGRIVIGDLMIIDDAVDSTEYYDPSVDDPSEVEYLIQVFRDMGFEASFHRTGKITGVIEAVL